MDKYFINKFPSLKRLQISTIKTKEDRSLISTIVDNFPQLEYFGKIDGMPESILTDLKKLKNLRHLDFGSNKIIQNVILLPSKMQKD